MRDFIARHVVAAYVTDDAGAPTAVDIVDHLGQTLLDEPPAAPEIIGTIMDRTYTVGSGPYLIDLATKISGATSWLVAPMVAGLSLEGAILTITPVAPLAQTTITVRGVASGRQSEPVAFDLTIEAGAVDPDPDPEPEPSAERVVATTGTSYQFSGPGGDLEVQTSGQARFGAYATSPGDYFVIPEPGTALTGTDRPSGDLAGNGHVGNGMMIDPLVSMAGPGQQGWDSYLGLKVSSTTMPYDPGLNVDPDAPGNGPLALVAGQTLVKTVRMAGFEDGANFNAAGTNPDYNGPRRSFDGYIRIHVLSIEPYLDEIPPAPSDIAVEGVKPTWRLSALRRDVARSLTMPGTFPAVAEVMARVPDDLGAYGPWDGHMRRMRVDGTVWSPKADDGYSTAAAPYHARLLVALHDARATPEQWDAMAVKAVRFGQQLMALYRRGCYVGAGGDRDFSGAGQGAAITPWMIYAGFLTGDGSYLTAARTLRNNTVATGFWALPESIGKVSNTNKSGLGRPVEAEMVGMPFINITGLWPMDGGGDSETTNTEMAYTMIAETAAAWDVLSIILLHDGPAGETGVEALIDGPYGPANQRAASLAALTRIRHEMPELRNGYLITQQWRDLFDIAAETVPEIVYPTQPFHVEHTIDVGAYNDWIFAEIAGGVSWNISGYDWNPGGAIEAVKLRWAMNQGTDAAPVFVQWIEEGGFEEVGQKTGLQAGVKHLFGIARRNDSGWGAWSGNATYFYSERGAAWRSLRTPTGTPAAVAPVFAVEPAIHVLAYPAWDYDEWTPAPAQLDKYTVRLAAGAGYVTGDVDRTVTYEWRLDGVPISGATGYDLTTDVGMNGEITCEVTVTTPSGTISHETDPVLTRDYVPVYGPPSDYYGTAAGEISLDINPTDAGSVTTDGGGQVTAIVNLANPGTHNLANPNGKDVQVDGGTLLYAQVGGTHLKFTTDAQTAGTHWLMAIRSVAPGVNNNNYRMLTRDNSSHFLSIVEHTSAPSIRKAMLVRTGATALNAPDVPASPWAGAWHVLEMRTDTIGTALYLDGQIIGQDVTPIGWGVTYLGGNNQSGVPVERIGRVIVVQTDASNAADDPEEAVLAAREALGVQFDIGG